MKVLTALFLALLSLQTLSQNEDNSIDTCHIVFPSVINSSCPPADGDKIRYNCIPDKFVLKLFNRWGNLVFETTDIDIKLDKLIDQTVTTGNNRLPQGTYFYIFSAKFPDGKEIEDEVGYVFKPS